MEQLNNLRKEYLSDGYIVVKSVFSKQHILNLREKMISLSSEDLNKYEILLNEDVQNLILNEKLFNTIKAILDTKDLLYYSDSSVVNHVDPFKNPNGFHNDARNEDLKTSYDDEYPIIRIGIYFENYKDYSGGLKIKKKSHKYFMFNFRKPLIGIFELMKILFIRCLFQMEYVHVKTL